MPKVRNIEKRIFDVEGFEVTIKSIDGKDIRGDASIPKQYNGIRMSRNSFSVTEWKDKFKSQFPGYEVDILDAYGNIVDGHTKLSTVRDTYISQED